MKYFIVSFIKFILSLILFIFSETYFYKLLDILKISISYDLANIILYLLLGFAVYIIFKDEVANDIKRFKRKIGNKILYSVIFFLILFIIVLISDYVVNVLSNSFYLTYNEVNFYNIFNKPFNLNLIAEIVRNILMLPFIKVLIFSLGINRLFNGSKSIFFSGLSYAIYNAFLLDGSISYILVNSFIPFIIFVIITYSFHKSNNIMVSVLVLILYTVFASPLYSIILRG